MIPIDTTESDSTLQSETTDSSQTRDSIETIQEELVRYHGDIIDEELRHRVQRWLMEANEVPGGDLDDYVTARLSELRRNHAMYHQPQHDDGADAFPEACSDCEHYGSRCPVITDNTQRTRREQLIRSADGPTDLRHSLREYAIDNGCVVLLDVLEKLSDHHEPLLRRGVILLMAVEESMIFDDGEQQVQRLKAALETLDEDPTADVLETVIGDAADADVTNGVSEGVDVDLDAEMERLTDGGTEGDGGFEFGSVTDPPESGGEN